METQAEIGLMGPEATEGLEPAEAGRGEEENAPDLFPGSRALLTLEFQTLAFQNYEIIYLCWFYIQ